MRGSGSILLMCIFSTAYAQTNHSAITPSLLIQLGQKFKRPLLQLVGEAFRNTEAKLFEEIRSREEAIFEAGESSEDTFMEHVCEVMRCRQWSAWSECQLDTYMFNVKTRTRHCGVSSELCQYGSDQLTTETENKVCTNDDLITVAPPRAQCPSHFEVVNGQFCFRYSSGQMTKNSAEQNCESDGGHLVHVDSQVKQIALHKFLNDRGTGSAVIWLDGKRKTSGGPWFYSYGNKDPSWKNWSGGEPSNGSSELCKVSESSPRVWWDRECDNTYSYVCEIEV